MVARKIRTVLVALSVAVLGASPGQSDACCFWPSTTTANYAPAPVCNPCNTCNYAPVVAYRTVYTNVPVVALRPISTVNPCTGCATTMLQPVTTYRLQPQLVPYTAYRPVMSACGCAPTTVGYAPACATGACGTAIAPAATTYYAPAATVAPAASGCCGGGTTFAPTSYAPAAGPSYASAVGTPYTPTTPSGGPAPGTGAPSLSPNANYNSAPNSGPSPAPAASPSTPSAPRTFQETPSSDTPPNFTPTPIPDVNTSSGTQRSNMIIPRKRDLGDLTTSKPITGSAVYRQTSAKVALPASNRVDDGGWRAAR